MATDGLTEELLEFIEATQENSSARPIRIGWALIKLAATGFRSPMFPTTGLTTLPAYLASGSVEAKIAELRDNAPEFEAAVFLGLFSREAVEETTRKILGLHEEVVLNSAAFAALSTTVALEATGLMGEEWRTEDEQAAYIKACNQ